jgi:4-hydroxyphenylpyruvate dioxygenase-like putative hemolysin
MMMWKQLSPFAAVLAAALSTAATAPAHAQDAGASAAAASATAEVKAGTAIARREVVGEAASFPRGTKVWAWANIRGAAGQELKFVWKRDGKVAWEKPFTATSGRYRTWTRHAVRAAGAWTIEVQTADGAVLGSVAITAE